jgi:ribulose-5-phosphate 4-epimerase/fuculose-1-phosphate aldolase
MADPDELALRDEIVRYAAQMFRIGLVSGTSGNVSGRSPSGETFYVTPSGVDYETMQPDALVAVALDGRLRGQGLKPSVDTPIHAAIYRMRPDVGAVIHTHSPYAAALSTLHRPIPPLITESAGLLGGPVRVIAYVPPARDDTGAAVADGLGGDRAILLPNHGVVAVGETPKKAFQAAMAVEESARIACIAQGLGEPHLVSEEEVARMHDFIHNRYGQR